MIEVSDRKQVGNMEFFTLTIDGITIKDCKLVSGSKGDFVAGPSVPMLGKDKTLMLDENGKGRYKNPITFSDALQKEIMAALEGEQVAPVANDDIPF
jgi:DNA-binding cell septation regulator SpoVG